MKTILAFAFVAFTATGSFAQEPPALSVEQKKDAEILALRAQLTSAMRQVSDLKAGIGACEAQLGPLQFEQNKQALEQEQAVLVADYEKKNPGWTLDATTGKGVKKPEAPKPAEPPKKGGR